MAAAPSISVVKSIPFKGGSRLYSNRYHFDGGSPADQTKWHALMDAITAAEKVCFEAHQVIVEAIGYDAGSDVPVSSKVYSLAGTHTGASGNPVAGESAALIRYSTAARTTKNHPIYLFNYYHYAFNPASATTNNDLLLASMKTSFDTYAGQWITGFSDGAVTHHRCSPNGALATGAITEEYLTHRDFPYTTSV